MLRLIVPILASLALILSGCQVVRPPVPPAGDSTPVSMQRATPTPVSTSAPPLAPRRPVTLTLWLPDSLVSPGNVTATAVLNQQVAAFAASQADVRVQVQIKRASGPGSLLDLMQTAAPVAPPALPDVALLDLASVPLAAQSGLLRPLNGQVPEDALADLFPFAEVGRVDERWLAIAYAVDVEHLVYPAVRAPAPPVTWAQIVSGTLPYLFPAGASSGTNSDALLAQYLAAGGRWLDTNGQPTLDATALTQVLRQLKDAQQAGVVPVTVLNYNSPDDTWATYQSLPGQIAHVRASRFITLHTALTGTLTAALPGAGESARLVARGWAFVVTSRDLSRAPVASALIRWLISAENEGALTKAAHVMPARRSAFDHWYPPDRYTAFLRRELERAIAPPPTPIAQLIGPAIQKAVADVLRGQMQPAEAATLAAASILRSSK